MNGKQAKHLRMTARARTIGAPADGFELSPVVNAARPRVGWAPPGVTPPAAQPPGTYRHRLGTTRSVYQLLKRAYKGKR